MTPDEIPIPVYALAALVRAAINEGAGDQVAGAIAHLKLLARQRGVDLRDAASLRVVIDAPEDALEE